MAKTVHVSQTMVCCTWTVEKQTVCPPKLPTQCVLNPVELWNVLMILTTLRKPLRRSLMTMETHKVKYAPIIRLGHFLAWSVPVSDRKECEATLAVLTTKARVVRESLNSSCHSSKTFQVLVKDRCRTNLPNLLFIPWWFQTNQQIYTKAASTKVKRFGTSPTWKQMYPHLTIHCLLSQKKVSWYKHR